jgi:nitric oxide reductase activation protein
MAVAVDVEHSTCTEDNLALALKIAQIVEDAAQSQPKQDEANDSATGSDPSKETASQGQGESQGDESADSEEGSGEGSGQDNGAAGEDDSKGGGEQPSQGGSSGAGDAQEQDGYSQQEIDAAKDIQSRMGDELEQTLEISDMISELIESISTGSSTSERLHDNDSKTTISDGALVVARQLKSKADDLQDALVTQTRCEARNALSGKRLNGRILSRVAIGNPRVFRQKHDAQGLSTAVTVLCDCSGSMESTLSDGVRRLDAAFGLMYGVADMLAEFEVAFSLVGYSDSYQNFKPFDADWGAMRRKKLVPHISGGTITGAAMTKALMDLAMRPEDRRLFVIITDGDTSDLYELMSCYSESKLLGVDVATLIVGELVPAVSQLASRFGFKATTAESSRGLSKFAIDRILEAV